MIKIILDSCSSMNNADALKKNITIVPMKYELNGKEVNPVTDNIDIKAFYDQLEDHDTTVKTSCVSPDAFKNAFTDVVKNGDEVLYIALSKGLSGSFNSAFLAKDIVLDEYPDAKIEIVNSLTGSIGIKLLLDEAEILISEGKSLAEIKDVLDSYAKRLTSNFTIGSLYHLYKGGRLNYTAMVAGRLLRFKPVIEANSEGKLEKAGTFIGKNKAIASMEETLDNTIDKDSRSIYVGHTNNIEECQKVVDRLKEKYPWLNVYLEPIDTTMGCHCGPNTIAIFYFHK
ncbi:MAG: DegV family protein [Acholeplasmatales bacterium]|nr:DegV family protein [Acholeplasmatales bacterium]